MTVRGSHSAAAAAAGAGIGIVVVLGAAVFLLGFPGLLPVGAFAIAADVFAVAMLLRPMSLSVEGTDLVYRSTASEKRIALAQVAGCRQVANMWAFSDSAGARLLAVQGVRFSDAAISALCADAHIPYQGPSQVPVDKALRDLSSGKSFRAWGVVLGAFFVVAIVAMVFAQFSSRQSLSEYQAAPACTDQATAPAACRLQTQARVTSVDRHQSFATVHMTLAGSSGDHIAAIGFPSPSAGDLLEVEVWKGRVTVIDGRPTDNNPLRDPNANLGGAIGVVALFGLGCAVMAGIGQFTVVRARVAVRTAAGATGGVEKLHADATAHGIAVPPCGVLHQPKVQLYLHEDPRTVRSAVVIVSVVFVMLLAGLVVLAIYVSLPIFAGLAVLLTVFYAIQLAGQVRELRFGGLYADDLHVAKITTDWLGRFERKVYERTSVLEVKIAKGLITVIGVDGSTLFWTSFLTAPDMDRFAEFLGVRVVREVPSQEDSIAVPPTRTPAGVLPVNVRKAAGIMQAIGGLCVFLGVINLIRIPSAPGDRRTSLLILLAALAAYGLILWALGFMLARGRPHSRELAIYVGGAASLGFVGCWVAVLGNPLFAGLIALALVPFYVMAVFWLRRPSESRQ